MDLLESAEAAWQGDGDVGIMLGGGPIGEVADGLAMVPSFSNVMPIRTGDGLVVVDTSHQLSAPKVLEQLRTWSTDRISTAIYTHGHIDHVGGIDAFDAEAADRGDPAIELISHEAVHARFDRYDETNGYNAVINRRQFGVDGLQFPDTFRAIDRTFRTDLTLEVGGERIELHHARGETDDHAWVWLPDRRALYPGDLFIWLVPNAGNPQKVQRYAKEWALALRSMAALDAEVMLPSHGPPVIGADRVREALTDTADLLATLHDQTVAMMNDGARLNDIIHTVQLPDHLTGKPYLQPLYDDPEFIVRNVWRLVGGWYDGDPSSLKPAPAADLAAELAQLAGGGSVLAERASQLAEAGDLRLAGHLAELAAQAAPDDPGVHRVRAQVNRARAKAEPSLMAKGVFGHAARDAQARADG